jgi:hypothetical protein
MRAPANRREVDRSGEAGVDQWPHDQIGIGDAELREEAEPEAGLDHPLNPIVAGRAEYRAQINASADQLISDRFEHLAIGAADVRLAVELLAPDRIARDQPVVRRQENDETLFEDRQLV